jgi:hypothetical protein
MTIKSFLFFCLLPLAVSAEAQYNIKENNVWAFGYHAGLDFNSGGPVLIQTKINGTVPPFYIHWLEGSASVCDTNGMLLFYCSADSIWNKNGQVMPNGYKLMPYINALGHDTTYPGWSTTQGALIMPLIDSPDSYYMFSLEQQEDYYVNGDTNAGRLFYSVVDMSLDSGLGDVVPTKKGIKLDSALSEKMTAIAGNNCDLWLLVHSRDTNIFKAYHVDANGLDTIPVISQVGNLPVFGSYSVGVIKCSPDRTKIALCNIAISPSGDGVELFNFDPATGQVVSSIGMICAGPTYNGTDNVPYGACFSADNSKLYIQNYYSIYQYDLSVLTIAAIINSAYIIDSGNYYLTDMRLGPDAKMYFNNQKSTDSISVISHPNLSGAACGFMPDAIGLLPGDSVWFGLPQEYVKPCDTEQLAVRALPGSNREVSVWPNPATAILHIESSENVYISITSMEGKMLLRDCFVPCNDLSGIKINWLAQGVYLLQVNYANGERLMKKIVKE